jgi:hypothetical protein
MIYSQFERAIEAPALVHVAAHWNHARQVRKMPRWHDIKPSSIAPHLSIVWSFRYDAQTDAFSGRLVGDHIARHIGKNFRGLSLAEAYPADAVPWVTKLFKRVITEPALYYHCGLLFTQQDRPGHGERMLLPLSDDGTQVDGVLGATVLQDANGMPLNLVEPDRMTEKWFSLSASVG